jgi:hypothetical protein
MSEDDYEVGYRKPPKHSRFIPGQSGNPKGRPSGTKNLATDLAEELSETITVTEGGQPMVVTKQRAFIKATVAKAMKGDVRAAALLLNMKASIEAMAAVQTDTSGLLAEDLAILEAYQQHLLEGTCPTDGGDDHGGA